MFPGRYFAARAFAPRYFPKIGGVYTGAPVPGRTSVTITGQRRAANHEVTQ